jgi:hypothetical protein
MHQADCKPCARPEAAHERLQRSSRPFVAHRSTCAVRAVHSAMNFHDFLLARKLPKP